MPTFSTVSQRLILAIGVVLLLGISAASIALVVKSRSDARLVDHTLVVLKKLSDLELLVRRVESASRGYAMTVDDALLQEYRAVQDRVAPAYAELEAVIGDDPGQIQAIEENRALVAHRLALSDELARLKSAGDSAGVAALIAGGDGRTAMRAVTASFRQLAAEAERQLAVRRAGSQRTRLILLAIELTGLVQILILAVLLVREARRSNEELWTSLRATEAANQSLEAAVAERTAHLVAAHEELARSTSVLQATFDGMAEAVLVIDTKGAVVLSNAAAERMLSYRKGLNVEQLRARAELYRPDGVTRLPHDEMPSVRVLRGEQFDRTEMLSRRPGRRDLLHFVVSGSPLRDASGAITGAALVYHDISEARDTERKLQQAQKLDAIGKLTGGVAHDFNNMLTVITGTTETLVAGLKDRPALQAAAALIDQAAERCAELIQHLLAFARKQPLQPSNVDINAAVVDIAKLLRPTLGEQIEIETILEPGVAVAHIDRSQLANSVLNMAINSRDAMPAGGKLLLETRNVVLDEAYSQLNAEVKPGPYVMLAVSDTGTGMAPELCEQAFEPFFTTKEVGKGSGLGLSMVYGFVKQSGGHIRIYSEVGHGTTIRLYLPPALGATDMAGAAAMPATGGTETILVVEDDALVRNSAIAQLTSLGYSTVAAADGRSALNYVTSGKPFDLLFTDIIMPGGMTGRELADAVAELRPGTRVLYTSGYTDDAIVHHGRLDEGVLLLTKPYRKTQLARMVREAIGG